MRETVIALVGVGRKVMDKLGKVIAFHPVKSGLKLFYEVIEPDGETR
jgi:hypothetical protein